MAADGSGRRAWRIEQHGVEFLLRIPFLDVGADQLGLERQPREIFGKPAHSRRRAVDGGNERARGGKLRRLAAGRGAKIGDVAPANVAEETRRQRRGGVLHPPRARGETWQRGHRPMRDGAHRAGRQHAAVELCRPEFWVALDREIERGFPAVRRGNGMSGRRAVSRGPARQQPLGRVEHRHVEGGERGLAFARDAPQHRIDQTGKARRMPVGRSKPHREIDGGMVGHVEKQDLRGAKKKRGLDPRRLRRQAAFEERPKQVAQGAEPAQHRSDQRTGERTVALVQRGELALRVEKLVERAVAADDALDHVGRDAADREAGRVIGARRTSLRVARTFHSKNASLRQRHGYAKSKAMPTDAPKPPANRAGETQGTGKRPMTPAAERALAEAAARRAERERKAVDPPKEAGGRDGLDPTRYGDWEINGLISDF